jgi:hypothetical protein
MTTKINAILDALRNRTDATDGLSTVLTALRKHNDGPVSSPVAEVLDHIDCANVAKSTTQVWDFFFTAERNKTALAGTTWDAYWKTNPAAVRIATLELAAGTTFRDALEAAHAAGVPRGSNRSGIFEVQNDNDGIWTHRRGYRNLTKSPAKNVVFTSWDEGAVDTIFNVKLMGD